MPETRFGFCCHAVQISSARSVCLMGFLQNFCFWAKLHGNHASNVLRSCCEIVVGFCDWTFPLLTLSCFQAYRNSTFANVCFVCGAARIMSKPMQMSCTMHTTRAQHRTGKTPQSKLFCILFDHIATAGSEPCFVAMTHLGKVIRLLAKSQSICGSLFFMFETMTVKTCSSSLCGHIVLAKIEAKNTLHPCQDILQSTVDKYVEIWPHLPHLIIPLS